MTSGAAVGITSWNVLGVPSTMLLPLEWLSLALRAESQLGIRDELEKESDETTDICPARQVLQGAR